MASSFQRTYIKHEIDSLSRKIKGNSASLANFFTSLEGPALFQELKAQLDSLDLPQELCDQCCKCIHLIKLSEELSKPLVKVSD